jgi:hypothetical protein
MADVGWVRRGHDAETMVSATAVESLDAHTGTWVRKTPYVSVSGYDYGAKPYNVYNLDDLTADQARTLAGLFELAGSAELAGVIRQAAALVDEEAVSDRKSTGGRAEPPTGGMWPDGEPQSVRDAADAQGGQS